MRKALSGKSGTIVGLDYQGTTVLAAHEPLPVLNLGIVAKVELTEVRAPFLKAGIIVVGIAVVVILVGTILFFRISDPIVRQILESEERFRVILETSPIVVMTMDRELKYTWIFNPVPGFSSEAVIGKRDTDLLSPVDGAAQAAFRKGVLDSGVGDRREFTLSLPSGLTTMDINCEPLRDAKGSIVGLTVVAIDITERKQVEEALLESEERLLAVTDHAPANIFLKDMEGRIVLGNKGFEEWNQTTLDEARGKSSFDLFPSWLAEKYTAMDRQVVESGVAVESEIETVKGDGSTAHSWNVKFPVFGFDGKVRWIGGIAMDITERKKALEELRENEQRFRDFAEVSSDWFWEMDDGLRFSFLSGRFFDLSSVENDDVIGSTRREMAGEEQVQADPEKWDAHFADLDGHKPFRNFVYVITSDDGTESHVAISGVPVFSDDGRFLGYRGTGTNVSALKQAEKTVWDAKEQAEFANRSKTEFLANMSHELRTPLTIINGASDILSTEMFGPIDNPSYLDYAKNIRDAGGHLLNLINDILNISQIEMGRFELDDEEVDVNSIVASCHRLIEGRAREARLMLKREADDELPPLRGDELRLKQVVLNLLSNAIKFTPEGGTVALKTGTDDGGRVIFSVSDTGIGIAAEDLSRVIDTFGQAEVGYSRKYQGAGIGLPLSRKLVELHGGTLELESELGIGTTVTVRFPLDRVIN
jgi:PAS domain S-box-containing protein